MGKTINLKSFWSILSVCLLLQINTHASPIEVTSTKVYKGGGTWENTVFPAGGEYDSKMTITPKGDKVWHINHRYEFTNNGNHSVRNTDENHSVGQEYKQRVSVVIYWHMAHC